MDSILTVRDLLLSGEPLDPAEVVAGQYRLDNPVTWVVSLRPYPPAFPRLRGGELALVATEHLARLEPPTTLADVVRQLVSRDAAGVAVRGEIDAPAIRAATQAGLPLLRLEPDAPLHDIEQAIMRACALFQARREVLPTEDTGAWLDELLAGRITLYADAQAGARRQGYRLAASYSVAYVTSGVGKAGTESRDVDIEEVEAKLKELEQQSNRAECLVRAWGDGLALLLPQGAGERPLAIISESGVPCGVGSEKPLLEAPVSLAEAQLAALASGLLHAGKPVRFSELGADRLLLTVYRDRPSELRSFVDETIGPLLKHDETSSTPVLPTLRAFIEHGSRLRETAADMYVHRNTLAYRLERIEEMLSVDLKDRDARLAIELALRSLPLVQDV